MKYTTRTRRRLDRLGRYRSNNFRFMFAQDRMDYPGASNILCEGDSWFGYPRIDLLDAIRELGAFNLLRVAKAGDELIEDLMGDEQRLRLHRALDEWRFELILYSGGGNDIVGDKLKNYLRGNGDPDDPASFVRATFDGANGILKKIEASLADLIGMVHCPILMHGYDYLNPSGERFQFFGIKRGPWIRPTMDDLGIPPDQRLREDIVKVLIDRYNEMLAGLAAAKPGFHHVDLRGTLTTARRNWDNEIHPTPKGFRTLAKKYLTQLKDLVPNGFSTDSNWRALSKRHRTTIFADGFE